MSRQFKTNQSNINPWNPSNKLLTHDDIYAIYEKAGFVNARQHVKINDLSLYQTAFVHDSYVRSQYTNVSTVLTPKPNNVIDLFPENGSYQGLEYLGDRCIDFAVAFYISRKYVGSDEGFRTILKTKIVKTNNLAKFAEYLGFSKHLIISRQVEENQASQGRHNARILEDVFEAFICAIFLDQNQTAYYSKTVNDIGANLRLIGPGWAVANAFIEQCIERLVDFEELIKTEDNHKQVLLIYYQKEFRLTPKYVPISVEGPPNNRIYTLGVLDKEGNIICRAQGKSKQEAEQNVSKLALEYYGVSKTLLLE